MLLLLAVLVASPALDSARSHLEKGKLDEVLFTLLPLDAVPAEEAKDASRLLTDASRLALARNDKTLSLQLAQMAARRDAKNADALKLLAESALRDTEIKTAVKYGKQWAEADPSSEEAKRFVARAEELDRSWTPPQQPKRKKARSWKVARAELQPQGRARAASAPSAARGDAKVIVYGASWCQACRAAIKWLTDNDVKFDSVDIERDSRGARELAQKRMQKRLRGRGIPVIDVNGILIEGFNPRALRAALERTSG